MSQTLQTQPAPSAPAKIATGGVKKGRNEGAKVITANHLFSGGVVYWTEDGSWTEDLSEAIIVEGDAALVELARAKADEANSVGPYLMDVSEQAAPAGRARLRETIRHDGPTIHPQFARRVVGA
ncbi:MAG: DUF2849 domain-containing protein [Parvularculaceae bacterium]|nr:DUF2849 domain-containing protein [Parvularculaceae bacterium]